MKILMLVNWKVEYTSCAPKDKQPPDYVADGEKYWFFRYFPDAIQADVIDVRSFSAFEHFEKNKLRFYIWQTFRILPRLKHYDVVLSHGMQSGIVLCLLRRMFGKGKYKHIVFDIGAFNSAKENGKALKLMQFASKSLDGVIYHTSGQKRYYELCHPWLLDKSRFIPFGADAEFFSREPDEILKNSETPYILCIGFKKRDWDTLLKAYNRVETNVRLRMIGNSKIYSEDKRVEVLPPVTVTELRKQIAGSIFGVVPLEAFNYSFGQMTLLQQMAMGKAVIAADVPSLRDYVTDGGTALCYPAGDERLLAQKIQLLLEDSNYRDKIAAQGKKAVERQFNERVMAEKIEEFIKEIGEIK